MPKLTALQPINHDGKDYQEGDTFTVKDDAQVAQLVEVGAAAVEGGKTKAQKAAETAAQAKADAEAADASAAAEAQASAAENAAENAAQSDQG